MNCAWIVENVLMFSVVLERMGCYDSDVVLYYKNYLISNYITYCPRLERGLHNNINIKINILLNNKFINNKYQLTKKGFNYLSRDDIREEIITNTNYETAYNLSTYNDSLYFNQGDEILLENIPETFKTFNRLLLKPTINYKREMTNGQAKGNCKIEKQFNNFTNFMREHRMKEINGIQNSDYIRYNYLKNKAATCEKDEKPYYRFMMSLENDIVCMNWNEICFTYKYYSERRIGPNYSDNFLRGPGEAYTKYKKHNEKIENNLKKKLIQIQKETDKAIKDLMTIRADVFK